MLHLLSRLSGKGAWLPAPASSSLPPITSCNFLAGAGFFLGELLSAPCPANLISAELRGRLVPGGQERHLCQLSWAGLAGSVCRPVSYLQGQWSQGLYSKLFARCHIPRALWMGVNMDRELESGKAATSDGETPLLHRPNTCDTTTPTPFKMGSTCGG